MIHICFCFSDKKGRYSKFVGTAMLSIFENTPEPVTVHILHDKALTQDNRDKFVYLAGQYNQRVKFYNAEVLCADKMAAIKKNCPKIDKARFNIATFYRFFLPYILPYEIEKIICLESNIIVNLDISELWQFELKDKLLAVVPNAFNNGRDSRDILCVDGLVKPKNYFNAGVLMINLKLLLNEQETIMNGIKFISENTKYAANLDQNILNYCFSARSLKVPVKFNRLVKWARHFKVTQAERMIYHYNSSNSALGLGMNMSDPFNRLWLNYFIKTPWLDVDSIDRFYTELMKTRFALQNKLASISATVSGKSRAFFVDPAKIDDIKKNFSVRENEFILIPGEDESSIQTLLDTMKTLKDSYVFFIMTEKFLKKKFPIDALTKAGFVEGVDFVKGWEFLPEDPKEFNSFPIIKEI